MPGQPQGQLWPGGVPADCAPPSCAAVVAAAAAVGFACPRAPGSSTRSCTSWPPPCAASCCPAPWPRPSGRRWWQELGHPGCRECWGARGAGVPEIPGVLRGSRSTVGARLAWGARSPGMLGILGVTGLLGAPSIAGGARWGRAARGPKMRDLPSALRVPGVLGVPGFWGWRRYWECWECHPGVPWVPRGARHTSSPVPLLAMPADALLGGAV